MSRYLIKSALFALLMIPFSGKSQTWMDGEDDEKSNYSLLKTGDMMFSGFVSYPNWPRFFADIVLANNTSIVDGNTTGFAPLGVSGEIMLSPTFGLSIDGIANSWGVEWKELGLTDTISRSFALNRYRILIGLNYHMDDLQNNKLNVYGGFALGPNIVRLQNSFSEELIFNNFNEFPLAFRARAGLRYFFTDNIAGNMELGLGGPALRFGITYRLLKDNPRSQAKSRM